MNSENSKTSDSHRLLLNPTDKIDLGRKYKYIALSNLSIYYTCKNIKKSYKSDKFKISAPIQNKEFKLPDGTYFVSGIQEYFEYILKKRGEKTVNPSIKTHINIIENGIIFKIKTGYYLEILTIETMKLLRSTKSNITKNNNQFHNILRLFNNLPNFSSIITYKHGTYELPHELPNNLRIRILGNQEISGKYLNFIEYQLNAKSSCRNESFVNTSRKVLKNRN